ncbi:MAG: YihY/virulence factor BrkB family protein [Oscillospiraceae bacterium]|jgi:membrane protein|nr:YihY/virulence factor BrkB family protein [Oscillospiraceae bacterium]
MKKGFRAIIKFVRHINEDDTIGLAAETAFFFLLSLFPLAMLADWALSYTKRTLDVLEGFLPGDLLRVLGEAGSPAPARQPLLAAATLWAASSGVLALMRGVNQAYGGERMPFIKSRVMALLFTLGFLALLALTFATLALDHWLLVLAAGGAVFLLLFALYTLTPGTSAKPARAAWTAALATAAWLAVSRGFEVYMRYFAAYDALYGSVGVFMGIAIWVFLICIVIVIGAELGGYGNQ